MSVDLPGYASSRHDSSPSYRRYPTSDNFAYRSSGSVTAAKVLLGITAGFLALNLLVSLGQSASLPALSYIIVIALTVLVAVAAGKVRESRAWGLSGGSLGMALAVLMLVMVAKVNGLGLPERLTAPLTTTLLISAAIYGALGLAVVCLLNGQSAREYFDR